MRWPLLPLTIQSGFGLPGALEDRRFLTRPANTSLTNPY